MSYLSIANKNINIYLNMDNDEEYETDEDIRNLIIDEFRDYLIENNYNNLDIIQFEELFKSNNFKMRIVKNDKYKLFIANKKNENKIVILQNKINYLLFILIIICLNLFINSHNFSYKLI